MHLALLYRECFVIFESDVRRESLEREAEDLSCELELRILEVIIPFIKSKFHKIEIFFGKGGNFINYA